MSNDGAFRTPPEELAALLKEMAEIRTILREMSIRLSQIDRHVKRAFGIKAEKPEGASGPRPFRPHAPPEPPTLSREEALRFYDGLVEATRNEAGEPAQDRLERLGPGDLRLMAQELGLPANTKIPKRHLVASILGRVRESVMLSKNVNVTQPRSGTAPSGRPKSPEDPS